MAASYELKRTHKGTLSRLATHISELALSGARITAVALGSVTLAALDRITFAEGDLAGECPIERVSRTGNADAAEELAV